MKMEDTRKILALQAIEQSDESRVVLAESDYREASDTAGAPLPKEVTPDEEHDFLSKRSDFLLIRTTSRFPQLSQWANKPASRHRLGIFAVALFLFAVVLGFLTNELGPEKRINILSFPLLGILLWSLCIYVREFFLLLRKRALSGEGGKTALFLDFLQPPSPDVRSPESPEEKVLEGARTIFQKRWQTLHAPPLAARVKSILHTTAFLLAASAILGMYLQGLANEYRAVWESTFFSDSSQLRPFLQIVLGPASLITGQPLPSSEELAAIHWQAGLSEVAGENAARWIHWYAITLGIFVLLPRTLLALFWKSRARRMEENLPYRKTSPHYFDHLLAISTGNSLDVTLVPYLATPSEETKQSLLKRLEEKFEKPVQLHWKAAVPFGEEDAEIAELEGEVIPVYDFSATPEKETHLALFQNLQDLSPEPVRFVLLDTSGFERKAKRFEDARDRLDSRQTAWENLFETVPTEILTTRNAKALAAGTTP
ncbi:MAG: DUF2868 domain-containing protein [Verrucomicrobiota bacterium]